jgi:hypothetical protein
VGVIVLVTIVGGVAGWKYHEQPQFCANTCQLVETYEESWMSSNYEVRAHANEGIVCLDCHEPTIKQQIEKVIHYVTNNYSDPQRESRMPMETCLSCKEHGTY